MASSSTSSIPKSFEYDVFLSFRGEDTRKNFIDHLYHALQQKSIHTYKDDERIKKGKRIGDELIGSIEASRFYIIVFSKNYVSSSWCLDELVKIMECHRSYEHTAYPVFYDVEPSEIRKQSGAVKDAFAKHEKEESVGKWSEALKEAADLAGWELKNTADGHEAKFIQKIVEELSLELSSMNFNIDENLVGMDSRFKDVLSSIGTGVDDVHMIGIKGMGGGGKTTLARAIFDRIAYQFKGKSFIENIREVSSASLSGLKSLQNQFLSDVLNDKDIKISSVHDGKHMIKKRMCNRKVIVVLDDVDHIDQLEALAGEPNWFKSGSIIIITTRDEQVLVAHRVKLIHDVNLLTDNEAILLFDRYAFGREGPIQGYKELSTQVVRYAAGLPLTIKVLGSFLCGKNELEWIDAIDRLKSIPLTETLKKLELSIVGLDDDYKEMFLDIACILKGWGKDKAIEALESCGFHARNGLRVLEQKSLVTISYDECVGMHDHIEEMGKNIVRRFHPDKPHKHSRLWIKDEIEEILANDMGTKASKCLQFHNMKSSQHFPLEGLKKMKQLRFLFVALRDRSSNLEYDIVSPEFPNALRYLQFPDYFFRSLPNTFQGNNLVTLKMVGSKLVRLWEGEERKVFNKLRFLDLSYSMLSTFDLGNTPNLETLNLEKCYFLVEVYMLAGCVKLESVDLNNSGLKTIDLRLAPNLETLNLSDCYDLIELHMPNVCLNLKSVILTYSKMRTLDIGLIPNLEILDLKKCYCLEELHMAGVCQKLITLDISHSKLRTLDLGLTPNLKELDLNECSKLVELRIPIGCLDSFVYFRLSGCFRFRSFLLNIREYQEHGALPELHLSAESLEGCPFHPDNNLPKLQISCYYADDRHPLTGIQDMDFSVAMCACKNLEMFSRRIFGLREVLYLNVEGSMLEVPGDIGQLEWLKKLTLSSTKIKHLPDSICTLKYLKYLKLESCLLLEKLPKDIGRLEWLENLTLSSKTIKLLPDSICMLKHLKVLKLSHCLLLNKLPDDLGLLECLKILDLSYTNIRHLPGSICKLEHLKFLKLDRCSLLEKLPEECRCLKQLRDLHLGGTSISNLPQSIISLKGLCITGSRGLLESCGFTSEIKHLPSSTFCYVRVP